MDCGPKCYVLVCVITEMYCCRALDFAFLCFGMETWETLVCVPPDTSPEEICAQTRSDNPLTVEVSPACTVMYTPAAEPCVPSDASTLACFEEIQRGSQLFAMCSVPTLACGGSRSVSKLCSQFCNSYRVCTTIHRAVIISMYSLCCALSAI